MGFSDRGLVRPGMKADLVLFDPRTVIDRSTRQAPREVSSGIERVWVNGEVVYEEGSTTGRYPGEVIRRE
jgi:N-acyl-D-amino-acid deacylase